MELAPAARCPAANRNSLRRNGFRWRLQLRFITDPFSRFFGTKLRSSAASIRIPICRKRFAAAGHFPLFCLRLRQWRRRCQPKIGFASAATAGCQRYSKLDQINRTNIHRLQRAWEFQTGELAAGQAKIIECTPLIVDGTMYITSGRLKVIALDAATGEERWRFDPFESGEPKQPLASGGVNRGVAYWTDGDPNGECRILHGTSNGQLFSLDAATGELDSEFGASGVKDLREDMEVDLSGLGYGPTSAPAILGDLVILGFSCGEGPGRSAPGDIRAFNVRSGEQVWRFRTVPRPGEFGNDTWAGDSWKNRGAANAWGGFSVDADRGIVFAGLGSAAFDFYGGDRHGQNLFANCTIALDGETGERIWHFQTLRHDLWDHDLPTYPNLVTVTHDGKRIDAVAQVTKTGFVFLFDRETGKPLFEVREVPVARVRCGGGTGVADSADPRKAPAVFVR